MTERKSIKCLDFTYLKLNDLEMIIKVTGKKVVKLFDEGYSYKYLDLKGMTIQKYEINFAQTFKIC